MASQLGSLIHDQNLNVHYKGASAQGKSTVAKASKKGGLGRRKPLGDLSNSVKPTPNQSLKNLQNAPEELSTRGRKALSDISNSRKPHLHEAPKKNLNAKLTVVAEEDLSAIAGEGFLHDHQQCIKAQTKALDIDEIFRIVGLEKGFMKQSAPPAQLSKLMPASPPRYLEEELLEDPHDDHNACFLGFQPASPPRYLELEDLLEDANFRLMESP